MTTTTYTIHAAYDHTIVATATPGDLRDVAQTLATTVDADKSIRFYIHNGRGVVGALRTRAGVARDVLRDDYMAFDTAARAVRKKCGFHNDPR